MLLRAKSLIIALTLTLTQAACDGIGSKCDPVEPSVDPIGPELFTVDYVAEPGLVALHRDGEQVQLLEGPREQPTLEVRATLSAAAIASIDGAEAALGSGEELGGFDQACLTFIDRPNVQLSLGVVHAPLSFRYPWGCPPSGLVEIDTVLRELVDLLPTCSPTPLVTDCEIIGEQLLRDRQFVNRRSWQAKLTQLTGHERPEASNLARAVLENLAGQGRG